MVDNRQTTAQRQAALRNESTVNANPTVQPASPAVPLLSSNSMEVRNQVTDRRNKELVQEDPMAFLQRMNQRLKHVATPTPLTQLTDEIDNYLQVYGNKRADEDRKAQKK